MKRLYTSLLLTSILMFSSFNGMASHIFGGEIEWTCAGQDTFLIKLTIYRDCNGIPLASASVPIKCATNGVIITTLNIAKPAPINITPVCGASCTRCQSSACLFPYGIEKYVFIKQVVLNNSTAGSCCKINMTYSSGGRSNYTTGGYGSIYIEASFNRCLGSCNNSPSFVNDPATIICIGQDFVGSFGALDVDKDSNGRFLDSITYEMTSPLASATGQIYYSGQYSYDKPIYFWGFPNVGLPFPRGFHLDNSTGEIGFRPMKIERTIMAVKITEYRIINGQRTKISETRRDIQMIVMSCPNNNAPILSGPYYKRIHTGKTLTFSIPTNDYDVKDTLRIYCDDLPNGASWSDNNGQVKHPTGVLTWKPGPNDAQFDPHIFYVRVKDDACLINGKSVRAYEILVSYLLDTNINVRDSCNGYYHFSSPNVGPVTFNWEASFDSNFNSQKSTFYYKFNYPGTYPYKLTLTAFMDTLIIYDTIIIADTLLQAILPADTVLCNKGGPLTINAKYTGNKGAVNYKWSTGDSTHLTINLPEIVADTFVVFEIQDSTGCRHADSMFIDIDELQLNAVNDQLMCPFSMRYIQSTFRTDLDSNLQFRWTNPGDTIILSSLSGSSIQDSGLYVITMSDKYCHVYDTFHVEFHPVVLADAGADTILCSSNAMLQLYGLPADPTAKWGGNNITEINGDYFFNQNIAQDSQTFRLIYSYVDSNSCLIADEKKIKIYKTPSKPKIYDPQDQCINNPLLLLTTNLSGGNWIGNGIVFGDSFDANLAGTGSHLIIYRVVNGICSNADSTYIQVNPSDSINLDLNTSFNKTSFCPNYQIVELLSSRSGGLWTGAITNKKYFNTNRTDGLYKLVYNYMSPNYCIYIDTLKIEVGTPFVQIDKNNTIICEDNPFNAICNYGFVEGIQWVQPIKSDGIFTGDLSNDSIIYESGPKDKQNNSFQLMVKTTDPICPVSWDTINVLINKIKADFSADVQSGKAYLEVVFTDNSTFMHSLINNWYWDFGDGHTSQLKYATNYYTDTGRFNVSLKIVSEENCVDSIYKTAFISIDSFSSITEFNEEMIQIYPNPTSKELIIRFVNTNELINSVSLLNLEGKLLDRYAANSQSEIHIRGINQPSGLYFLKIESENGISYYRKIMLE